MRQKRVLLAFVETVHLVHKHDGAPRVEPIAHGHRHLHRFADFFHAAQHRADRQKLCIKRIGHQTRDGGFAHTGRAPQNAAVRLARLKRHSQCHALAQQMLLTNDLAQGAWAQAFGEGDVGGGHVGEEERVMAKV